MTDMTTAARPSDPPPADGLSDWERSVNRYAAGMAEHVGLRDWTVIVQKGEPARMAESTLAHCETTYGRKVVVVSLAGRVYDEDPEEIRDTVVHELLHAHLDEPAAVIRDLETQMGTWLYEVVHETYKRANENAVDAIAKALARHLPLPPPRP